MKYTDYSTDVPEDVLKDLQPPPREPGKFAVPHYASKLEVFQFALYLRYLRVCQWSEDGTCTESTRESAKSCRMSVGKVSKVRKELAELGYIHLIIPPSTSKDNCTVSIAYDLKGTLTQLTSSGFVYLIWAEQSDLFKIGMSNDPQSRLTQIQSHTPSDLILLHSIQTDDMARAESEMHERFAGYRKHGEWFALDRAAMDEFIAIDEMNYGGA